MRSPANAAPNSARMSSCLYPTESTTDANPREARYSRRIARKGRPATGASGLGRSCTTCRSRVPRPPARMIASIRSGGLALPVDRVLGQCAEDVAQDDMPFLDVLRLGVRHRDPVIREVGHRAAVRPG